MPALTAVYNKLVATTAVTDLLAVYKGAPALFTFDPAPEDCANPVCILTQVGGMRDGVRGQRGGKITILARVWGDKDLDNSSLRNLAMKIWEALNRAPLTDSTDYHFVFCLADVPQAFFDTEGFPGYRVQVTVSMLEKE